MNKSMKERYLPPGWSRSQWSAGWTVERTRLAIDAHNRGQFLESWSLAVHVSEWSKVFGALRQRVTPTQNFQRSVRGAAAPAIEALVREEASRLFVGEHHELGRSFPSLWTTVECLALMGFAWWQTYHRPLSDGTLAPVTEFWTPDATWHDDRGWHASTTEGTVDIAPDDPRWTLIAQGEEPWRQGAVRAVGLEFVDAMFARYDRSDYAANHGRPKPYAILPLGAQVSRVGDGATPTEPTEGDHVLISLHTMHETAAGAVFSNGTELGQLDTSAEFPALIKEMLDSDARGVAIAILGTDGTLEKGTGGVYVSPMFEGVAFATVSSDVRAISDGVTQVLNRWRRLNYAESKVALEAVIEMPDEQLAARMAAFQAAVKAERDGGFVVTQPRVDELARLFNVPAPKLAVSSPSAQSFAYDQDNGVITIGERRAELGKAPSDRDHMTIPAYRALLEQQKAPAPAAPPADPAGQ